jgi:hypothetical protein
MSDFKKFKASNVVDVKLPCEGPPPRPVFFCKTHRSLVVFKAERLLTHMREAKDGDVVGESDRLTDSILSFNNSAYLMQSVMKAPAARAITDSEFAELKQIPRDKFTHAARQLFVVMMGKHGKTHFFTRVDFVAGLYDLGTGDDQVHHAGWIFPQAAVGQAVIEGMKIAI